MAVKINIFEGARRIALLIAGLATIGTVVALVMNKPYVSVTYGISNPSAPFVKMESSSCPSDAGSHYFTAKTSTGKQVSVTLCMLAMPFPEAGERPIPYRVDDQGMMWGARSYSSEISVYERQLEQRFRIPSADEASLSVEISRRYRESLTEGIRYLVIALAIFGAVVWAIGWIVRGFLGIPRGMDRRPD